MKYRSQLFLSSIIPIHLAPLSLITIALIFMLIPKYAFSAQVALSWDPNLDLDETYFFAVTASDDAGNESNFSSEVSTSFGPVELVSPNSGEIVPSGSVCPIEWEAVPEAEYFKLQYSLDEGRKWTTIKR